MGYTSVKGGADAILAAEHLLQELQLDAGENRLQIRQILHQLGPAVDKVMGEGGVYAPELAALAIKQAEGDLFEAAFLLRAYRSTLPRFSYSLPVRGADMHVVRRISSAFRDVPGGQLLGRTRDYTQRLLDFSELNDTHTNGLAHTNGAAAPLIDSRLPTVSDALRAMNLLSTPVEAAQAEPFDVTRTSPRFPVDRPAWLQILARGESGAMVCLAYSSLRGYGGIADHGTVAELRVGDLPVQVVHPLTGQPVTIGEFRATEVEMVGGKHGRDFGLSYGLVFGQHERKAIAMALLDSTLMAGATPIEGGPPPAHDQEMVLHHIDGIESFGFLEHLKLPHYVTFGSTFQSVLEERAVPESEPDHDGHDGAVPHHHGDGVMHTHAG
jgi:alpha-D-ribose 1-methylphosphonate 5-triphosphate synthase subunit PhnI